MKLMLLTYVFMPLLAIAGIYAVAKIPDGPCADMRSAACHRFVDEHNAKVHP